MNRFSKEIEMEEVIILDKPIVAEKTITRNGTYKAVDDHVDGYNVIHADVEPVLQDKTITENGEYEADRDFEGLDKVTVDVQPPLQDKTITENGNYNADSGFYGLGEVEVDVQPPLQEKTVTENGEVTADSGFYGLDKVNVDVPPLPLVERTIKTNGVFNAAVEGFNGYSQVNVEVPDNSADEIDAISFYDFDGLLLKRISLDQLPITTEDLPTPPPHEYLIFSEWTHTLSEINEAETGLNIGAVYDTVGGKTYAFIEVNDSTGYSVPLNITKTGEDTTLSIKVFDTDSETEVVDLVDISVGAISHTLYLPNTPQKYRVELYVTEGSGEYSLGGGSNSFTFIGGNNQNYRNTLLNVFVGNNNVTSISSAFYQCHSLTNATIPNSLTSVGSAFNYCYSLKTLIIPKSVTNIFSAFQYCSALTNVIMSNSVTSISQNTFASCRSLKNIIISNSVTSIGNATFSGCLSLTNVTIPNSVTSIGNQVFASCSALTNVIMSNSATSIGERVFDNCYSLTNVKMSDSLASIGNLAFRVCSALTSIIIPKSVTNMGTSAFYQCYSLKIVDMTEFDVVLPLPNINVFTDIPTIFKIKVKQSMVNAYKTATNWSVYADNIVGVEV